MSKRSGLLIFLLAGSIAFTQETTKNKKQFTARELFYSAAAAPAPPPKPQSRTKDRPKAAPVSAVTVAQTTPASPKPANSKPSAPAVVSSAPVILAADQAPSTAPAPSSGLPLGLKYTVMKLVGHDRTEVLPSTVFRAGDSIQLDVETNLPGYLYIISQGSSGTWRPMFPSPEVEDGNNRVEPLRRYEMPPGRKFTFDERVGTEKIFIVFSREPEQDLEKLIYSLQKPGALPAAAPAESDKPKQLVQYAAVRIDDATVGRLRNVYSRDLIIEKVDPKTPGERKETAVYVVNPSGSAGSRVVADINLVHQ